MKRRKKTPFRIWENTKEHDGYVRLAHSFLDNEVIRELSGNAFKLYVYNGLIGKRTQMGSI